MDSHREAVEKIGAALNSFLQAGGSGNSNELASKLQELLILISNLANHQHNLIVHCRVSG